MTNVKVFNSTEFGQLEIMVMDGKELFPATDVANMLGYSNPNKAVIIYCRYLTKRKVRDPQSVGKILEKNFIPEGDVRRLIIGASSQSQNQQVKKKTDQFELWIFDEVLPDIRKHGLYAPEALLDDIIKNPEFGVKLFVEYKETREQAKQLELANAQQQQIIGELQPKASYYDTILQNEGTMPITQIAKDYGMSGRAMNQLLKVLDVQYRMSRTWLLYQEYADQGYTQSRTHLLDTGRSVMHTYWTQKGRLFLYDLLKNQRGLLPMIERSEGIG